MRRSVRGIWIGLLVLALSSASIRFVLFAVQDTVPSPLGFVFNYLVAVIVIVAVWVLTLRFIEGRQRRQVTALLRRSPGAVSFPSLPTRELEEAVRLLDPTVELDRVDALTVQLDISGVRLRHRGGDSLVTLIAIERERVLDVGARTIAERRVAHPAIAIVLQTEQGLLALVFPAFQPARPFHRATAAQAEELAGEARAALGG